MYELGTTVAHTRAIFDDEPTPNVEFVAVVGQGSEANARPNVAVRLSGPSSSTVTVMYSVTGGTADQPEDFTQVDGTLSFPPLAVAAKLPLTVVDEFVVEPNETLTAGLDGPANATLGTHDSYTYTIKNNDSGFCEGEKATLVGTAGADIIARTPGRDVIVGRGGADRITSGGGNDVVCAGSGDDVVSAGTGNDVVFGERGDDALNGQGGKDILRRWR